MIVYVDDLIIKLYEDNISHFDDRDTSDDCDCHIHNALNLIYGYVRD